jgi:hypothetical protein
MKRKKLRRLLLLAAIIYILWKIVSGCYAYFAGAGESSGTDKLLNRVWISNLPDDPRKPAYVLLFVDKAKQRLGASVTGTAYKHLTEMLSYTLEGDQLTVVHLQDNKTVKWKARTWTCKGEAPKPFDLCLELKGDVANVKLYSGIDWVIRSGDNSAIPPLVRDFTETAIAQ